MDDIQIKSIPVTVAFKHIKDTKPPFMQKLISWWSKSKIVHTELIIDDMWVSSDLPTGGVTIQPLRPLTDKWEYIELGNICLTNKQHQYVLDFIKRQEGKKYDTLGIVLSQVLPWRIHSKEKWFCSEIVTKILQLLTYQAVYDYEPQEVSPSDLHNILITYLK